MKPFYIHENITDDELKKIITSIPSSERSVLYRRNYYEEVLDKYIIREFKTTSGKKFSINVPIKRKPNQHEIDEAYYFYKRGYNVAFLDEPKDSLTHPDLLLNDSIIVELKQVSGNANTAARQIRAAINKQSVDIPVIFFVEKAVYLEDKEILKQINRDTHIKRNVDYIVIIRNYKRISILKKKGPGAAEAAAWSN